MLYFHMVITRSGVGGLGSGFGLGSGTKLIDEGFHKFITSNIMRGILDATAVMFGTINEGIVEMMEEHFRTFRDEMSGGQ